MKKFNQSSLIVEQPDGQPGRIVLNDLPKLWAAVQGVPAGLRRRVAAIKQILRVGGIQTDQTVRAGEPVAVELDDGTPRGVSSPVVELTAKSECALLVDSSPSHVNTPHAGGKGRRWSFK